MINTKQLEKRWYRYKTKNFILFFAGFLLFLLLPYGGYYLLDYANPIKNNSSVTHQIMQIEPKVEEKPPLEMNSTIINRPKEEHLFIPITPNEVTLSPTIPIVDLSLEPSKGRSQRRVAEQKRSLVHKKEQKQLVQAKSSTYLTPRELSVVQSQGKEVKRETQKINFKSSSSNYMEIMKQKFYENKNSREAMLLANAYYNAGNYKKSEKWALKANSLNRDLEESWLLFAKSKEQQGSRKEALKILETYYNKSQSSKAKALIQKIHSEGL